MKSWFAILLKFLSVVIVIGIPTLVIYGLAFPWSVVDDALPQYRGSTRLLLGVTYNSRLVNEITEESAAHIYAVVPMSFQTLSTVVVTKDKRGVHVEVQPFGLLFALIVYFAGLLGIWWFFIRRHPPAFSPSIHA